MWERGLKLDDLKPHKMDLKVAPLVGAWIEMSVNRVFTISYPVAPLVGAWIEIRGQPCFRGSRGGVAPLVGAWIEIP